MHITHLDNERYTTQRTPHSPPPPFVIQISRNLLQMWKRRNRYHSFESIVVFEDLVVVLAYEIEAGDVSVAKEAM